jgi:hypothetical protein
MATDKPQSIQLPGRGDEGIGPHDEVLTLFQWKPAWNAEKGLATIERE